MKTIGKVLLGLMASLLATPALATGSVDCTIDDANLSLALTTRFSYGGPGKLFQTSGEWRPKITGLPEALGSIALSDAVLTQHWLYHADLRLELYAETSGTGPFASVMMIIITEQLPDDELTYSGTYNLKMQMPEPLADGNANIVEQKGKISCSVG